MPEEPKRLFDVVIEVRDTATEICDKLFKGATLPEVSADEMATIRNAIITLSHISEQTK